MSAEKSMGATLRKLTPAPSMLVAGLTSIGEIGIESSEIDVTTLDSANGYKEFIASLKDAGEVSLAGILKDESNMEDMLALADAQTLCTWEIEFLSGSAWTFTAFLKMFKESESTVEGARGFTASLRVSGKPTYYSLGVSA